MQIKKSTVDLIARLLRPLADIGALSQAEEREIIAQLQHLVQTGETIPVVIPKLIDQPTTAEMLGISLANFKKIERAGGLPFKRKQIGTAVRYRNTDVVKFIWAEESLGNNESRQFDNQGVVERK